LIRDWDKEKRALYLIDRRPFCIQRVTISAIL